MKKWRAKSVLAHNSVKKGLNNQGSHEKLMMKLQIYRVHNCSPFWRLKYLTAGLSKIFSSDISTFPEVLTSRQKKGGLHRDKSTNKQQTNT